MSYTLQRLKLATVCREIVDTTAEEYMQGVDVAYTKILELDRKVQKAHSEIPEFFRLDPPSRRKFSSLYHARPTISWQRCLLQQGYYSRLCRLHREYFIRGAREPAYSYSHVVSLQSARKVLEIKRIMDEDVPTFTPPSSVIWSVMHHVFMAAVILLLDVCFNWDDILAEKRKEEVLEACRMLSKARKSSSLVNEGINAMMSVLQRHWKSDTDQQPNNLPSSVLSTTTDGQARTMQPAADPTYPGSACLETKETSVNVANVNMVDDPPGRQLEDIWSEMLDNGGTFTFENTDWTGLLNELTNATVPCSN
ncbi:hypothetical protein BDV59DRAFT_200514 [Aspergillus ambiguus]|uniref:transcription factor domain-containing protein n=1 Tax=Aspergillus ambiguus TaxID=176160 RepID=UPI003CCC9E74